MSFENKVKRLSSRDWIQVSDELVAHTAELSAAVPGAKPAFSISEINALGLCVKTATRDGESRFEAIPGLGAAMLHEGIYMLHKSANVLVACHDQVVSGLPTWSLPTGYQAAFFASDAISKILGVAILEIDNIACTVDIWPKPDKAVRGKALAAYVCGSEVQVVRHERLQHFNRWTIFKRLMRMSANLPVDEVISNALQEIDDRDFARQRNDLHYETTWGFDDLHTYFNPPGFFDISNKQTLVARLESSRPDFSVALATTIFSIGASLLKSLGRVSTYAENEHKLLVSACTAPRMKLRDAFELAGIGLLA